MQARSISIDMAENNRVSVELKINLKFGFNVPTVAEQVQKAVIEGIEKVTGMTVVKVNVVIQEIDDEEKPEEESEEETNLSNSLPLN